MKQKISKQQWRELLNEQQHSGLSIAAFCRDNNINAKNFYNHSHKAKKASQKLPSFVKAQIRSDHPMNAASDITLRYGKAEIHLPVNVSPQWLAQVLSLLA